MESSCDDHDQECPVVADHTFPHPTPSFKETSMSEEMQDDLIEEIVWRLDLQSMLEEEERERVRKEVEEDDEREGAEVLDFFKGRDHIQEKEGGGGGLKMQSASKLRTKLRWKRLTSCTGHELHVVSTPNFKELLGKDSFAVSLCQTKDTSSLVPLGGCDGGQSMLSYLVWGYEIREETKESSRVWRLSLPRVPKPSLSPVIPHARDLRLHLIDENFNFKKVLGWTET
ncbi:unnamed protein product [Linum trigynum]|uniref:Uncharacterized protein n=1 Tax=Linum trigynum TaxID=586398 RepID=A0AAV2CWU4_9ROSI